MALTFKEIQERDKKETLDYHNFEEWHAAGYKGQGFNFLEIEDETEHGRMVIDTAKLGAPEAGMYLGTMSYRVKGDEVIFCNINYKENRIPIKEFIETYNIHVIGASLSNQSEGMPQPLIEYLRTLPVVWIGSAGNDGNVGVTGKFEYLGLMSGAIYLDNGEIRQESYSGVEKTMDFATLHSWPDGTSFSSPILIAMTLVLFSKYGFIPQDKLKRVLKRISIDAGEEGHDPRFGYGVPILPDNCIIDMLDNPLWTFRILHQSTNFDWKIGDWITKGEKICRMGNSGTKDFHVHIDAVKGIHPQYSLMMLTKKLLQSLKHCLYRFLVWDFFKYSPVITTEYMEEGYPEEQNVNYEHMALDLVPENRHYTNENYDVYYPLEVPGKVLNLGTYLDGTKYIIIGVDENMKFEDVPQDKWYFEEIDFVSDYGLMAGYPDGTFKPDKEVTRAELAQVLYNLEHK